MNNMQLNITSLILLIFCTLFVPQIYAFNYNYHQYDLFYWNYDSQIKNKYKLKTNGVEKTIKEFVADYQNCITKQENAPPQRGEYETKEEYKRRISNNLSCNDFAIITGVLGERSVNLQYDADGQFFTFKPIEKLEAVSLNLKREYLLNDSPFIMDGFGRFQIPDWSLCEWAPRGPHIIKEKKSKANVKEVEFDKSFFTSVEPYISFYSFYLGGNLSGSKCYSYTLRYLSPALYVKAVCPIKKARMLKSSEKNLWYRIEGDVRVVEIEKNPKERVPEKILRGFYFVKKVQLFNKETGKVLFSFSKSM